MFGFDIIGIGTIIGSIALAVVFIYLALKKSDIPDPDKKEKHDEHHSLKPVN